MTFDQFQKTRQQDLTAEAEAMTNQDGRDFLHTWIKGRHTITEISKTPGNWFLALDEQGTSYFIPYDRDNTRGCKAGVFGNRAHYEKHKVSITI